MTKNRQTEIIEEWNNLLHSPSISEITEPLSADAVEYLLENFIRGGLITDLFKRLAGTSPERLVCFVLDTTLLLETELACSQVKTLCEGLSNHVADYWYRRFGDDGVPKAQQHAWRIMLASLSAARDHSGLPLLWGALEAAPDEQHVHEALVPFLPLAEERFFDLLSASRGEIRLAGIEILERAMQRLGPPPAVLEFVRDRLSEMAETDRSRYVRERAEKALVAIKNAKTTPQTLDADPVTALFLFDLANTEGGQGFDGLKTVQRAVLAALGEALGGWGANTNLIRGCYGDLFPWTAPGMVATLKVLADIVGTELKVVDDNSSKHSVVDAVNTALTEGFVPFALGLAPLSPAVARSADVIIRSCVDKGYLGVAIIREHGLWKLADELRLLTDLEVKRDSARGQWQLSRNELRQLGLKRGHRTTTAR